MKDIYDIETKEDAINAYIDRFLVAFQTSFLWGLLMILLLAR